MRTMTTINRKNKKNIFPNKGNTIFGFSLKRLEYSNSFTIITAVFTKASNGVSKGGVDLNCTINAKAKPIKRKTKVNRTLGKKKKGKKKETA
jgi:hypothetical protein